MASVKVTKIGSLEFTSENTTNNDPYIIALFADENCGKTRFCLTGPDGVGCLPLEMKAYVTLDKDSQIFGRRIFKPKDPKDLLVPTRKVQAMTPVDQQKFYKAHVEKIKNAAYALLEHKDVNLLMIDKFTTFCQLIEFAVNGVTDPTINVNGSYFKPRGEMNQNIIDFIGSLSEFGKPVILTNASKPDYDVLGPDKKPLRATWDGFKYLGSHCNIVCELRDNKFWDPKKSGEKFEWHYELAVRRCQKNPDLEGPIGNPLLRDESIMLPQLIQAVDENVDLSKWM